MPDLQQLIRDNQPIYVRNRTGQYLPQPSPYVLEIHDQNKRAMTVIIPATKYPFLLSNHVPPHLLKNSTEFYEAVSRGILELMDPEKAKEMMADPMAQEVVDAALRRFQPVKRKPRVPPEVTAGKSDMYPGAKAGRHVPPGADVGLSAGESTVAAGPNLDLRLAADQKSDVSQKVIQICMDLKSDTSLADEKLLQLAGMENITEKDIGYVLSNCKDQKELAKVVKWAKAALADMSGLDDEDDDDEAQQKKSKRRR